MYCNSCGSAIPENSNFCANCGAGRTAQQNPYDQNAQNQQAFYGQQQPQPQYQGYAGQKSKLVAGLLQIFLCAFGVGRFYLGYNGMAVAQLLVSIFTLGIGAIWPFIDGIMILTGSVQVDANGVPLKD